MSTERKLASIRRIKRIDEIKGADRIVKATVDGWELVTQKSNNFQPGDLVVYFEIDSLLPLTEQFSFLEQYKVSAKNSVNGEGYRLKTIRLRGQISQGLILPLSEIVHLEDPNNAQYIEGMDLTDALGVKKYEKPIPAQLAGKVRGNFPSDIPKTDQERIQNIFDKWVYGPHFEDSYEVTLKLDGSSFTAYYRRADERFGVCSRNLDLAETEDNAFWQVARKHHLQESMAYIAHEAGCDFAIQCELMGPGVQGNREKLDELEIFLFDIYDITSGKYLDSDMRFHMAENILKVPHVPLITIDKFTGVLDVKTFLDMANIPSLNNDVAEGIVFKSIDDPSFSFKVINQNYLLGEE